MIIGPAELEYSSSTSEYFTDDGRGVLHMMSSSTSPIISSKKLKKSSSSSSSSSKNKRRFSDEQIRSLEVMFESETKLEPRKKVELAKDLGLQPRQVAIWFQNKRARWKSKQVEKDYGVLLSNYNNLASQFESLKRDNNTLLLQLQKLKDEMKGMPQKGNDYEIDRETTGAGDSSTDGESDYKKIDNYEIMRNNNDSLQSKSVELEMLSDNDSSINLNTAAGLLGLDYEDHDELLQMVEPAAAADSSLTTCEDWGNLDTHSLINHTTDQNFQWLDFWS